MKLLYDLFPGIVFLAALLAYDIYVATALAIAAAFVQVGYHWLRHRAFETMHLVTLAALVVFGGLTLWLRDEAFIKWKPTIVYWTLAGIVIGSQFIGKNTLFERLLGLHIELPPDTWRRHNLSFGIFLLLLGMLNLYVAFYFRLDLDAALRLQIWGYFKVFGTLVLTFAFLFIQVLLMAKHIRGDEQKGGH